MIEYNAHDAWITATLFHNTQELEDMLLTIRAASKVGRYNESFANISEYSIESLRKMGYVIESWEDESLGTNRVLVSWKHADKEQ